jgi:hypothetical protein
MGVGTSTYGSNYIVCFKCFLIFGVRYISYQGFQTKFYKFVAVIVYASLKRKSWFIAKTQFNITEVSVLYTKTMNLLFHLYGCDKPPQPYRWCSFGCKYSGCSWWCCKCALGILWSKLAVTVVIVGPWASPVL